MPGLPTRLCPLSLLYASLATAASAAPPTVTPLYPAGAQRGTTTEVTAAGTFDHWPVKVWASGAGVTVEAGKEKGKFTVTVTADAEPGVYALRAHTADGAAGLRPFVVGTLPEVAEKEPNDEAAKPQPVAGSVVVNGQLAKPGDVDCFAIALTKGQTLVADLDASRGPRSPMDGVLQVVSADGFVLARDNDTRGLDPRLAFAAPKDGTYVVRVFAFPATPDSAVRLAGADTFVYRLTLTTGGFADFPVPLAVQAGGPRRVALEGWNLPPAAREVKIDAVPPDRPHLTLCPPGVANPVRVRVEPHPCFDPAPGPDPLAPPFSATVRVDAAGKEATVKVAAKKGVPLAVRAEGRSLGLAADPVVRVLGAGGEQLARAEPPKLHGDTALSFTPPADGVYTLAVADLAGGGGPRHAVLLRVAAPEPDYELAVAADRFAVPPGGSLAVPVKVTRRGGFAKPVEVVAEGLPAGVTTEVKPPAGKADPNTVTVILSGGAAGAGGPFRLVGRVAGEPLLTRPARAAVPELDDPVADLWVSVTAAPVPPTPKKK
ncbi:MAG: pre-peptidase [Isosphaera sp.]|nr:pre-peptidase [Isosphaera sp.]